MKNRILRKVSEYTYNNEPKDSYLQIMLAPVFGHCEALTNISHAVRQDRKRSASEALTTRGHCGLLSSLHETRNLGREGFFWAGLGSCSGEELDPLNLKTLKLQTPKP